MNMVKLRQILEIRRATKQPPLIPPKKSKRGTDSLETRKSPKEILDIHLQLRNFRVEQSSSESIACAFSESDDAQRGPWRVTAAAELLVKDPVLMEMPSVFAVEFQLDRLQFIRLEICDLFAHSAVCLGYCFFTVSELVCAPSGSILRKVINDELGTEIADACISCTLRPKPHTVLLQLGARSLARKNMTSNSSQIFFEIHQTSKLTSEALLDNSGEAHSNGSSSGGGANGAGSLLYRSELVKYNSTRVVWRSFTLQSTEVSGRELRLQCFCRDGNNQNLLLGEFPMSYAMLSRGPGPDNSYFLIYESSRRQKKSCGLFELLRVNEVSTPTFLEYISSGMVLNLAFGIDFSRPDSAVDEASIRRYVDNVELAISAFGEALRDFNASNSYAAFGFGAKIPPHFRESQEFCLNLDTDPYCRGLSGIVGAFKNAFANVQPINIAHYSHVIYYIAKLAQNALNHAQSSPARGHPYGEMPPYFVLVLITRGVFDDLKETVQAIIFASRAPISVVFVGIGDEEMELGELERLGTAGTRLNYRGRKPERDCIQYVSLNQCRSEESKISDLKALIVERGLLNVPWQVCNWMGRNGFKPHKAVTSAPLQQLAPDGTGNGEISAEPKSKGKNMNSQQQQPTGRWSPQPVRNSDGLATAQPQGAAVAELGGVDTAKMAAPPRHPGDVPALALHRQLENRCSSSISIASSSSSFREMLPCSPSTSNNSSFSGMQNRFRNLELESFSISSLSSLPATPRRLPSTTSLGVNELKNPSNLPVSGRRPNLSELRSNSTQAPPAEKDKNVNSHSPLITNTNSMAYRF